MRMNVIETKMQAGVVMKVRGSMGVGGIEDMMQMHRIGTVRQSPVEKMIADLKGQIRTRARMRGRRGVEVAAEIELVERMDLLGVVGKEAQTYTAGMRMKESQEKREQLLIEIRLLKTIEIELEKEEGMVMMSQLLLRDQDVIGTGTVITTEILTKIGILIKRGDNIVF